MWAEDGTLNRGRVIGSWSTNISKPWFEKNRMFCRRADEKFVDGSDLLANIWFFLRALKRKK